MAHVRINTGPVEATTYLEDVPREQWHFLVSARKTFLRITLPYDCRELLRFVEEAKEMAVPMGYHDVPDFIRRGLDMDPALVGWAVDGLRTLKPDEPLPLATAVEAGKRSQAAAQQTTGDVRPRGNPTGSNQYVSNCSRGGQALEAAKNGLSDWGIKWWAPILEPKNILQVNDLVVIHRFFLDFSAHPSKNPLVRGVNSYIGSSAHILSTALLRSAHTTWGNVEVVVVP